MILMSLFPALETRWETAPLISPGGMVLGEKKEAGRSKGWKTPPGGATAAAPSGPVKVTKKKWDAAAGITTPSGRPTAGVMPSWRKGAGSGMNPPVSFHGRTNRWATAQIRGKRSVPDISTG